MKKIPVLQPGDWVELIAPASRCTDRQVQELQDLMHSWGLNCLVKEDIFGDDLLCANTDKERFRHLHDALLHPYSKAIICLRGGYGAMRLLPKLAAVSPPDKAKIFVGMSDTTSLQLYLQQQWHWPTIHGAAAPDRYSPESIHALKKFLFGETDAVVFTQLKPLNRPAQAAKLLQGKVSGGNLTLIQASIGTSWQLEGEGKFILLEEVGERGYRIDRMLEHLRQAHIFQGAQALLLADFLNGNEPNGTSLVEPVLTRFAQECDIPVLRLQGIGHGWTNLPILCETTAQLQLGVDAQLTCFRN